MSNSSLSIKCPHCRSYAATRTSREITAVYREIYLQCSNFECGHTFKAAFHVVGTISPSAMPDPKIAIPMLTIANRRASPLELPAVAASNDDMAPAANEDHPPVQFGQR